jgi:hypothetical protein
MIELHKMLGRGANRLLRPLGLELTMISLDFDARLESPRHMDRMYREIGDIVGGWLQRQRCFNVRRSVDVESEAKAFFRDYLEMPFRSPKGGCRFGNLFWLNILANAMQPDVIVDSGTYTGGSAWALSRGAPGAQVLSFDIDLSRLLVRIPNVEYFESDWKKFDPSYFKGQSRLIYFDDHVDQGQRLLEAWERGCKLAVFDDDFTVLNFASMAHDGRALPKISFILDDTLKHGEVIEWSAGGQRHSWRVDRARLDEFRLLIDSADRLPDVSSLVGIDQLPFRIVTFRGSPTDALQTT